MDVSFFVHERRSTILDQAEEMLERHHLTHYEDAEQGAVRARLEGLFDVVETSLETRNLAPIVAYARKVAQDRFAAHYDLFEVQTAFNALEAVTWRTIIAEMEASAYASALGSLSTVLGAGKDSLAQAYVECATSSKTPTIDVKYLFRGQ
ncbi:MAG: hypothetical protein KDA27_09160 [Candidatus Eisenbacteria bacterium]|uniref:Uncharacterized protein n=1 Tax=Eiseniibacteriota bacterium TaxID=2212470 RepID=A0A956NB71_UNCEI|nr:hypothetical protein [Candidatus Eisenbacteria bacterium]MCB9466380.1 hypothetical protein [Candidatus Eisenbacteria bacterium]